MSIRAVRAGRETGVGLEQFRIEHHGKRRAANVVAGEAIEPVAIDAGPITLPQSLGAAARLAHQGCSAVAGSRDDAKSGGAASMNHGSAQRTVKDGDAQIGIAPRAVDEEGHRTSAVAGQ